VSSLCFPAPAPDEAGVDLFASRLNIQKGRNMPCPDKKPVRAYLTVEEYAAVQKMAHNAGLSVSRFLRDVSLGVQVRSFEYEDFKLELLKTRAELGRLGGLLKLALTRPEAHELAVLDLRDLLAQIGQSQKIIKEAVERL